MYSFNYVRPLIREHRKRLKEAFKTSPSLKQYYAEIFSECYQDARELAADETGLSIEIFPETSPFSLENVIDTNYLPNNW
ncbi:DUF29 domain-containing protein [Crocosphaera sp. XPORK-15E]|nr:DUF29 domain-containing protein [Crocosphaera sp. XPORK-15E]MEA5532451.1 DUF29 domain-containing protein [Crocosphaera sp. XPORK-15E]